MKYRKAVFVTTYTKTKERIEYLILRRKLHWKGWEFPKGGINKFETKKSAAKRELFEETNLKPLKIKKFNLFGKYKYKKPLKERPNFIGQSFSLYAIEVKKSKVKVSEEHSNFNWVSFNDAIKKLKWPNQRKSLKIVNSHLEKKSHQTR